MKKLVITGLMTGMMVAGVATAQEKASWTDSIKASGDARFRFQNTSEDGKEDRERWRFRGRVKLKAKVNDQVKAEIRLVTNAGDPISDNITMGGIGEPFDDANVVMDRANFTWTPVEPLSLKFGKMGQPWVAVNDLVMSGDASPEGIALNAKLGMESATLVGHAGAFVLKERKADDETTLYTGQIAAKFGGKTYVMIGGTVYAYDKIEGYEPLSANNNSTMTIGEGDDAMDVIANEFMLVEGFAEVGIDMATPVKIGAQYLVNTEANDDDTAYLGYASIKLPAGFSAGYQYRHLEKDSTFSGLAESTDFGNAGVDLKGHVPYVKYAISKNFSVKAQYAVGQKGIDDGKDVETLKIDLACKF